MSAWWTGIPDAQMRVTCGTELHTLRWHAGELQAVDHEDLEGERTLAALGGDRCTCVDLVDAWARHAADPRVLTLARRSPSDQIALEMDWRGARRRSGPAGRRAGGWTAYAPGGPFPGDWQEIEDELVPLLCLEGGLPDRLVATVAAAWAERGEDERAEVGAQLVAALFGRVAPVLRAVLAEPGLEVDLVVVGDVGERSVTRTDDGRVRAALPFAWLSEVWCRDLAFIAGRFCLGATAQDATWTLRTLAPDLANEQTLVLRTG